jgi:hypothetical protein
MDKNKQRGKYGIQEFGEVVVVIICMQTEVRPSGVGN